MNHENFKDAKYPCATTRRKLKDDYLKSDFICPDGPEMEGYHHGQLDLLRVVDKYLARQYYLRDKAIKLLNSGVAARCEIEAVLKQIGTN
jgi:hypothetical protein